MFFIRLTPHARFVYVKHMAGKTRLSTKNREFFELVSLAAFSNPFSEERIEFDLRIAGCSRKVSERERVDRMVRKMRERVQALQSRGEADVRLYGKEEGLVLQSVFMFEAFHLSSKAFDQLIVDQIEEGDNSCSVPFAGDILGRLVRFGFSEKEAPRYLSMLYQLHRAYYFIDRGLVGQSQSMKQLRLHLWNNVFTKDIRLYEHYMWDRMEDFSTLLLGETGTGKGTAAAAIGRSGFIPYDAKKRCFTESFMQNFIPINLSSYTESLIESELFGHRKGAFTGAIENHKGIFARCSPHGSIFLDEIGDVSIPVQLKLLQILQDRTFSPVGSHERVRFNGRVIAATNRTLDELRREGLFRDDFFYRLCSDSIVVPSLRRRIQENASELDAMLENILTRMIGEPPRDMIRAVHETIRKEVGLRYPWPGNVRELEQAVRRILLSGHYRGDRVVPFLDHRNRLISGIETGDLNARELLSGYCCLLYDRFGTYEEVSRRMNLDRRTVKRYIELWKGEKGKIRRE